MARIIPNRKFRNLSIGICCLVAIAIGCCWGCQKTVASSSSGSTSQSVTLVISGDTAGWIVPCGCTSAQSGGLLRRATLVGNAGKTESTIVADVGGAASGISDYHRTKFESILRGELAMGLAAHNLGQSELALGPEVLKEIMTELYVPFLSANTLDSSGAKICPSAITVTCDGATYLLIGVVDPSFATPDVRVSDPKEAILKTIETLRLPEWEGIFVLAYCPQEKLMELASQLPEVDAIVGGPTGQTLSPQKKGATIVCSATNKGKFVVQLNRKEVASGWQATVVEVDASLQDQPMQVSNLNDFRRRLADADFPAGSTAVGHFNSTGAEGDLHYSGNDSCLKCHVRDREHWTTTKHAHAWESLKPNQSHVDPFCQQCHTTGYAQSGGFQTISSSLSMVNVGCESCHGPSSLHVAEPARRTPWLARDQCLICHDRENSPNFKYDEYWATIVHGVKIESSAAASGKKVEVQ